MLFLTYTCKVFVRPVHLDSNVLITGLCIGATHLENTRISISLDKQLTNRYLHSGAAC